MPRVRWRLCAARRVAGPRGEVVDRAQLGRIGDAPDHERTVGDRVVDESDHPRRGYAEREADRAAALDDLSLLDEPLGLGILDVVDAGELGLVIDLRLVGGV